MNYSDRTKLIVVQANSAPTVNPTPHKITWTVGDLAGQEREHRG